MRRPRFPLKCSRNGCFARSKYAVHLLLFTRKEGEGPIFLILPIVVCAEHKKEMTPEFLLATPCQQAMIVGICKAEHLELPRPGQIKVGFRRIHRGRKKKGPCSPG